jgi:hypothetical protein
MNRQIEFSEREWQMMLQLLEAERKDMHSAVRRSMTNLAAHEEFQQELKMVEGMIAKIQEAVMHPA